MLNVALILRKSVRMSYRPSIEHHLYGPGGELLDDADLQGRNQRAWEHMRAENQLVISRQQVEVEIGYFKLIRLSLE
jgi:hypothetical protein